MLPSSLDQHHRISRDVPDQDAVKPALGSTCGRRGRYPTVLGRPAPDAQAHYSLGLGVAVAASSAQAVRGGSRRLKSEWVRPVRFGVS